MPPKSKKATVKQSGKSSVPNSGADQLALDVKMLQLLVCPLTKHVLEFDPVKCELKSKSARLAYPIRGGVPIMLQSEARSLEDNELV